MSNLLCSERSFNNVVHPIYKKRVESLPYKPTSDFWSKSYWNKRKNIFLDVLTYRILYKTYNGNIPKDHTDKRVVNNNLKLTVGIYDTLKGEIKDPAELKEKYDSIEKPSIRLTDQSLRSHYKYLKDLRWCEQYKELYTNVANSSFRYKMQVKSFDPEKKIIPSIKHNPYMYYNYVQPSCFGEYNNLFTSTVISETRDDRLVEYKFDTPIGILFYHNIVSLHTIWYPEKITMLSDNAFFIYKRYFGNLNKKNKIIYPTFQEVKSYLGYSDNDRHIKKKITEALDELKESNLIEFKNSRVVYNNDSIKYTFTKVEPKIPTP